MMNKPTRTPLFRMIVMCAVPAMAGLGPAACGSSDSSVQSYGAGGSTGQPSETGGLSATFADVYMKVIEPSCAPCHTTSGSSGIGISQGKLDLTSQAAAYKNLVGVAASGSACNGAGALVTPGNPDASIFYLKVSLDDASPCGAKMPFGGPPLTQEQADIVESWITGGAVND